VYPPARSRRSTAPPYEPELLDAGLRTRVQEGPRSVCPAENLVATSLAVAALVAQTSPSVRFRSARLRPVLAASSSRRSRSSPPSCRTPSRSAGATAMSTRPRPTPRCGPSPSPRSPSAECLLAHHDTSGA
jgi:hypothetical protein